MRIFGKRLNISAEDKLLAASGGGKDKCQDTKSADNGNLWARVRSLKTFDSLGSTPYRYYFLGMMGQWAAMNMQQVTQSLLIYRLTNSPALLGVMALAHALPMLFLSLLGGVIADRVEKKRLIQVAQIGLAINAFAVAITLTSGYLAPEHIGSWWVLIATSVFQGVFMAMVMPARQSIIPELVRKEQVMNAVALNTMGMNIFQLIAPAAAGLLIDTINFEAVFYVMGGLCVMAIIITSFIPSSGNTSKASNRSTLADVGGGLKYIWGKSTILLTLGFTVTCILLAMPYQRLLPIFADDILKVGATGMGVMMSVNGAGALVGSLVLASLPNKKRGVIMLASGLILGGSLAIFAFSKSWLLSLIMMVLVGVGRTGHMTMGTTLLQTLADREYLGRVMSVLMMNMGLVSLGTFVAGILAESIGAPLAIGGFAIALVVISILVFAMVPRVRKLD